MGSVDKPVIEKYAPNQGKGPADPKYDTRPLGLPYLEAKGVVTNISRCIEQRNNAEDSTAVLVAGEKVDE